MSSPLLPTPPQEPATPPSAPGTRGAAPPEPDRAGLLRAATRVLAGLLFALPVLLAGALLRVDLAEPPATIVEGGPRDPSLPGEQLAAGARYVVHLPEAPAALTGVMLFPVTSGTSPRATLEVCHEQRCVQARRRVRDGLPLVLPVPDGLRGGELAVTLVELAGGALAFAGTEGQPAVRGVSEVGWQAPLRRARDYFAAGGPDLLLPLLGLNVLVLIGLVGLASWRGMARG